jgi:hypothetical protein
MSEKAGRNKMIAGLLLLGLLAAWVLFWLLGPSLVPGKDFSERGQFGDMFGVFNALITTLGFWGLLYNVKVQNQQIADAEVDAKKNAAHQEATLREMRNHVEALERVEQNRQTQLINGILAAVLGELKVSGQLYSENMGAVLDAVGDGEFLRNSFSLKNEYFNVYKASVVYVGQIEDTVLRDEIIQTYSFLFGLIDQFLIYNAILERANIVAERQNRGHEPHPAHKQILVDQTAKLKRDSRRVKESAESVIRRIEARFALARESQ